MIQDCWTITDKILFSNVTVKLHLFRTYCHGRNSNSLRMSLKFNSNHEQAMKFLQSNVIQVFCISFKWCIQYSYSLFLAYLSWKLKWAFLINCCPSICLWTFHIFIFFSRTTGTISAKLSTKHPWLVRIHVYTNKGPRPFLKGDNNEIAKIHWRN